MEKTQAQLTQENNENIATNGTRQITGAKVRGLFQNIIDTLFAKVAAAPGRSPLVDFNGMESIDYDYRILTNNDEELRMDWSETYLKIAGIPEYIDNHDAIGNGMDYGHIYHTGGVLRIVYNTEEEAK